MANTLKGLPVSVLMTCLMLLCCINFMLGLGESYNQTVNNLSGFSNTTAHFNKTQADIQEMRNITWELPFDSQASLLFYVPYKMVQYAWNAMKIMYSSITSISAIITDSINVLSTDLGFTIPIWIVNIFIALLALTIIFIIVEMYLRWKLSE